MGMAKGRFAYQKLLLSPQMNVIRGIPVPMRMLKKLEVIAHLARLGSFKRLLRHALQVPSPKITEITMRDDLSARVYIRGAEVK
jgi:hypothetical protein